MEMGVWNHQKKTSKTKIKRAASASTQGQTDSYDTLMKMFMPWAEGLCSDKGRAGMVPQQQIPQEEGSKITGTSKDPKIGKHRQSTAGFANSHEGWNKQNSEAKKLLAIISGF